MKLALATALACLIPSLAAALPQGNTGGGTVYYDTFGALYRMTSSGSGKTLLLPDDPLHRSRLEPSRQLHAGSRWYLVVMELAGQTYPNGKTRRELFVVREDADPAYTVQLTDQADVDMELLPRWMPGDAGVSFIARRWAFGAVSEGGVYSTGLVYDVSGNPVALTSQPGVPSVSVPLASWALPNQCCYTFQPDLGPDLWSFDWSPSGSQIVYDRFSAGALCVANAGSGASTVIYAGYVRTPAWSPDGTKIALMRQPGFTQISTVTPTGGSLKKIASGGTSWSVSSPSWSPTGSHLVFARFNNLELPLNTYDVYRTTSSGNGQTNLTNDVNSAFPLGVAVRSAGEFLRVSSA